MKLDVSLIANVYACTITEKKLKVFATILMWFEVFEITEIRGLTSLFICFVKHQIS